jgi:hypothetical protein
MTVLVCSAANRQNGGISVQENLAMAIYMRLIKTCTNKVAITREASRFDRFLLQSFILHK